MNWKSSLTRQIGLGVAAITMVLQMVSCEMDDMAAGPPSDFISALPENVPYPADNPYFPEKEDLGRLLYWDPILSGTKDVACVSCHHPDLGYADGLQFSRGVGATGLGANRSGGFSTRRNAPTVINAAFNGIDNSGSFMPELSPMFWDNRTLSLERQALLPMLSKEEMRGKSIAEEHIMDTIIQRLNNIPEYVTRFEQAFGSNDINPNRILAAIATFERGIIANNSPFDQYMRGNPNALTAFEIQGMNAFIEVGCAECHSGPMFSDYTVHTIGVKDNISPSDEGASGNFDFRTPTLRNLKWTAPYMHNGIHATLEEVMEFYESVAEGDDDQRNVNVSENGLDEHMQNLELDGDQIDAIIAFMNSLNDDDFDKTVPESVPSGLPVGGKIF